MTRFSLCRDLGQGGDPRTTLRAYSSQSTYIIQHFQISAGVFTPFFSRTRSEHSVPHGLMAFQDILFVSDGAHLP
jgi:hypothetical protein